MIKHDYPAKYIRSVIRPDNIQSALVILTTIQGNKSHSVNQIMHNNLTYVLNEQ